MAGKSCILAVSLFAGWTILLTRMIQTPPREVYYRDEPVYRGYKNATSASITSTSEEEKTANTPGSCELGRAFKPTGSMPLILLLSFPGSGNTWVRYLLERSTGIYSGSVYNDKGTGDDENAVFRRSDPCSKTTLVVKTHGYALPLVMFPRCPVDGAIFLIRNPYNAIIAEFNRREGNKTTSVDEAKFKTAEWKKFVKKSVIIWRRTTERHLAEITNRLIVFYEDLVEDTERELRRMIDYLNVPENETRIRCLLTDTTGSYKRKHKQYKRNPYSVQLNVTVDENIAQMREIMRKYNITLPSYDSAFAKDIGASNPTRTL